MSGDPAIYVPGPDEQGGHSFVAASVPDGELWPELVPVPRGTWDALRAALAPWRHVYVPADRAADGPFVLYASQGLTVGAARRLVAAARQVCGDGGTGA